MRCSYFIAALFACALCGRAATLETGYRQMYDLRFDDAHRTFHEWKQTHPEDPLGPVSDAAAYLFAEFDRLGILESEFFTSDKTFRNAHKLDPDPEARRQFEAELAKSDQLANRALAADPADTNALFARVLRIALHGDYAGLIEKRYMASLSEMKSARTAAAQLLAQDPHYYDAYLAAGVENYLLGSTPGPLRLLLRVGGSQADRSEGLARLRVTAEKGNFLMPFARLLLAVAALRDNRPDRARELLAWLAREYPHNHLYASELAKLGSPL